MEENAHPTGGIAGSETHESNPLPELFFATVRAMGTNLEAVTEPLRARLNEAGYHPVDVHLSPLLTRTPIWTKVGVPEGATAYERRSALMTAGDVARTYGEADAMARLGVREVCSKRPAAIREARLRGRRGIAYILRSLMHEAEVRTLRDLLGPYVFVVSAFSSEANRRAVVRQELEAECREADRDVLDEQVNELLMRDQGIGADARDVLSGVDEAVRLSISRTFHEADLFVDVDRGREQAGWEIERFVRLIFSDPMPTMTKEEVGMGHAFVASLQSGSVARRVGASVLIEGQVVVSGRNDRPRAGGGQVYYGEAAPTAGDEQDRQQEASDRERRDVARDLLHRLLASPEWRNLAEEAGLAVQGRTSEEWAELAETAASVASVRDSRVFDLIEFIPVVHAEMSAITTAARAGVPLNGGTLYTTTFPCHECTRHIIAAGIGRVVYLEPYPKSRAAELFAGEITLGESDAETVKYVAFMGVAPRAQGALFSWLPRKVGDRPVEYDLNGGQQLRPMIEAPIDEDRRVRRRNAMVSEQSELVSDVDKTLANAAGMV